jgi:CheY-like chemotaxis protein
VEQLRPQEIAHQLSLSPRQLRREHHAALEVLADKLWQRFDVAAEPALQAGTADARGQSRLDRAALNHELAWLSDVSQDSSTDPDQVLPDILRWTEQLAAVHRVQLQVALASAHPKLAMHPVALRQILLNLLSVVIPRASAGRVDVSSRTLYWEVEFRVRCCEYPSGPKPALDDEEESLLIAHRLADLCGCTLVLSADGSAFDATLGVPRFEQLPVLVVDDNVDALQLFQRYATGSRYRLFTTRDPEQVASLVEKFVPQIIVLDVMMPQLDGWKLLEQLRHHPLTADLPIIVCTILPHKELGLLLGANDFVHKPVSRQDFLSVLDDQVMQMRSGSR